MMWISSAIILSCLFVVGPASGFDYIASGGIGLGQTVVLSEPSAVTLLMVPSGELGEGQGRIELGAVRRFEMSELDQGFAAAAYRVRQLTVAVGVTQFGDGDYYAERTGLVSTAYCLSSFSFGLKAAVTQFDFGGHYDNLTAASLGLGFSYHLKRVIIAATGDNINRPRPDEHSERIRPSYSVYTELMGHGSYSVTGKVTVQEGEEPVFGIGQKVGLSSLATVFWGVSTAPIMYGGGLELIHKRSLITYATSYHPTLGFSHTLAVGFKLGKRESGADDKSEKR